MVTQHSKSEAGVEDTVTIIEDYYKDEDKGQVWYRWRLPNEEKWHVKLTPYKDLPYVRFVTMSKAEFKEYYEKDAVDDQSSEQVRANTDSPRKLAD